MAAPLRLYLYILVFKGLLRLYGGSIKALLGSNKGAASALLSSIKLY